MIGRSRHEFPELTPTEPVDIVRLSDLLRALVTEKLHGQIWPEPPSRRVPNPWTGRLGSSRPPRDPIIQEAENWGHVQVHSDLGNGSLIACVPAAKKGGFRIIPREFWQEEFSSLSVGGTLLDFPEGIVSGNLHKSTIFVFEENAYKWMLNLKINDDNPDYPRNMRKCRPLKMWKIPSDEEIKRKLLSLIWDEGFSRDGAAKRIGLISGFKGVENAHARRILKDCDLKPCRRPKKRYGICARNAHMLI